MVLTVSFALSLVIGLSCHHHRRIISASLTSASRCQDHTPSPSATLHIRLCARRVHRILGPTFVTIRETPLLRAGTLRSMNCVYLAREANYFLRRGWTAEANQPD